VRHKSTSELVRGNVVLKIFTQQKLIHEKVT